MKKITLLWALFLVSFVSFNATAQIRKSWDFRTLSQETIENLLADPGTWTPTMKDDGTFDRVADAKKISGELKANGVPIKELQGLTFGSAGLSKSGNFMIATNRFRMSRDKMEMILPKLAPGQKLTVRARSANGTATNRGIVSGNDNLEYVSGPKGGICVGNKAEGYGSADYPVEEDGNYTLVWKVREDLGTTDSVDVKVKMVTGGLDIVQVIIDGGDEAKTYNAGYLYSGATAMEELPLYGVLKSASGVTFKGINIDNGLPHKDSLMAYDGIVLDGSLPADNAGLVSFLKENIYWQPVFNVNGKLAEALGFGTVVETESPIAWVLEPKNSLFKGFESAYFGDSVKCILSETASCPMVVTGQENIKKYVALAELGSYTVYKDSLLCYVYNSAHNQYAYYGVSESYSSGADALVQNLFIQTLDSKSKVTATSKPIFAADYKNMETVVSISCLNKSAEIYYTTDGSEPTLESPLYTEPIVLNQEAIVSAIAIADGYTVSEVDTFKVELFHQAKAPVIACEGGGMTGNAVVTLVGENDIVDVYYNFTGSENITESSKYDGPITLSVSATIYAFAVSDSLGLVQSDLVSQQVFANVDKIRRDELAHFKVTGSGWNTLDNLTLDGEQMVAWSNGGNYYFSWGKSAAKSYDEGDAVIGEDGELATDENGNFIYEKIAKAPSVTLNSADPDWQLVSCGQVMLYQNNELGSAIGDGSGYNPERAEDYLEQLGTKADIQLGAIAENDGATASIQSTKKFAGPFNVVAIVANANGDKTTLVGKPGVVAVQVSKDSITWEQVGDSLITSSIFRCYKKFEVAYEGTDEVYVRLASIKGSSQAVHDIYVFNHGEKSAAMKEELAAGIEEVVVAPETVVAVRPVKKVVDGKLVIVVGDAVYSVTGARLK